MNYSVDLFVVILAEMKRFEDKTYLLKTLSTQ